MIRFAKGALVILAVAGMASATTVTCPAPPNPGVPMNAVGLAAYCGGITFSNFQVMPFGNNKTAQVYLGSMNVADKWMSLAFNPGAQRINLLAEAGGNAADGAGGDGPVRQGACSAVVPASGRQQADCPDSSLLANLIAVSGTPGTNQAEQRASSTARGRSPFGGNSDSPDSLTPGGDGPSPERSDVPEPAAFLLAGPALLGLRALRRKAK